MNDNFKKLMRDASDASCIAALINERLEKTE